MALPLPTSLSPSKRHFRTALSPSGSRPSTRSPNRRPCPPPAYHLHRAPSSSSSRLPPTARPNGPGVPAHGPGGDVDPQEYVGLELDDAAAADFAATSARMVDRYFTLEDPQSITPIGLELFLTAQLGSLTVRGIIDRLELDQDGELVVTDYKTGRAPSPAQEQSRLGGVHFYSLLCERVLGRIPSRVQLLLGDQPCHHDGPLEQSTRGVARKLDAIWSAVEQACDKGTSALAGPRQQLVQLQGVLPCVRR